MRQTNITPTDVELAADLTYDLSFNKDIVKAQRGNKTAARRVRKKLLKIQKVCKTARVEMLQIIKS